MRDHVADELAAYAEEQVAPTDRARVEQHLAVCAGCRDELARVRHGIALASSLQPQPMPADLAVRIRQRIEEGGAVKLDDATFAGHRWWHAAAAVVLAAAALALYWQINRPWVRLHAASTAPTAFERDGRQLHDALIAGTAPLSFVSSDEAAVWQWLESQGAPVTSMRVNRPADERVRFVALGATVRTLDGAKTSVLAYRIDGHPVTLALALAHDVPDAPVAGWWTKRVMHRREATGVNTLTWTVGGGTYVMVSELEGAGQRACLICHTAVPFRERIQDLGIEAR